MGEGYLIKCKKHHNKLISPKMSIFFQGAFLVADIIHPLEYSSLKFDNLSRACLGKKLGHFTF